jgi:hypothetical protein
MLGGLLVALLPVAVAVACKPQADDNRVNGELGVFRTQIRSWEYNAAMGLQHRIDDN